MSLLLQFQCYNFGIAYFLSQMSYLRLCVTASVMIMARLGVRLTRECNSNKFIANMKLPPADVQLLTIARTMQAVGRSEKQQSFISRPNKNQDEPVLALTS